MTATARLGVAGSGRSAPSAAHPQPYRNRGGMSAKPAADLPPNVCNIRLSEVRNFRLSLTGPGLSSSDSALRRQRSRSGECRPVQDNVGDSCELWNGNLWLSTVPEAPGGSVRSTLERRRKDSKMRQSS